MLIRSSYRNNRGGNLAEAAVGLMLVFTAIIIAALLFLNSGAIIYNQQKLGFIAHSAAVYAATLPANGTRQSAVDAQIQNLASNVGLGNATIPPATISDSASPNALPVPTVTVSITASIPTMMSGFGNLVPQQVQLSETAVAAKQIDQVASMQYLYVNLGSGIYIPLLNTTGTLPNDGLPAWTISIAGVQKTR